MVRVRVLLWELVAESEVVAVEEAVVVEEGRRTRRLVAQGL